MRYSFAFATAVVLLFCSALPSFANRYPLQGDISVEVVSDSGSNFQKIGYVDAMNGFTRVIKNYLEAKKGERYSIVVHNNSPERVGLVIAVDGRNIISGKRSELTNREDMYLLNGYDSGRYEGWRTSSSEVHRFYFTEPTDSYSVRTFGDSSAMGVVAVAVYRENGSARRLYKDQKSERAPSESGSRDAARPSPPKAAQESAGTGFGETQYSPVITVAFEPEKTPVQKTLVKYEWRETLCRKGLLTCGRESGNRLWDDGYAPYPPEPR